jgi:hypothetical protein
LHDPGLQNSVGALLDSIIILCHHVLNIEKKTCHSNLRSHLGCCCVGSFLRSH